MSSFKRLFESPVGEVGRTGAKDAQDYVTPELRAEFKKIIKKLGGKAVARQLLAEMNAGGSIIEGINFKDLNIGDLYDDPKGEKGMIVVSFDKDDETIEFELDDGSTKEYTSKELKRLK